MEIELLEDRSVPSTSPVGVLSGVAFIDANHNGVLDAGETVLPGVAVTLSGTSTDGRAVNAVATTDANGAFNFQRVLPGTYQLSSAAVTGLLQGSASFGNLSGTAGVEVVSGVTIGGGQTISGGFSFLGLAPNFISMRLFLSSTTSANLPFSAAAGSGTAQASGATLKTPIKAVSVKANSADTVIDLAGNFTAPDFTNSQVRIDTSAGPVNVQLFDTQTPQTVANFFDYVTSGAYNNSIFHRLVSNFVLQGGGFSLQSSPANVTSIAANPAVPNEFGVSNTVGTVAMAKLGNDPNSATNQFFFNLADNSSNLDHQNGGFTVFGKIVGAGDQAVLNTLANTPIHDESTFNGALNSIPLKGYSGTKFPTDTTASNYLLINDVAIVKRDEFLTYSVLSNTNPTLVTATVGTNANEMLTLHYAAGQTGTATITVQATDRFGVSATASFTVTVS